MLFLLTHNSSVESCMVPILHLVLVFVDAEFCSKPGVFSYFEIKVFICQLLHFRFGHKSSVQQWYCNKWSQVASVCWAHKSKKSYKCHPAPSQPFWDTTGIVGCYFPHFPVYFFYDLLTQYICGIKKGIYHAKSNIPCYISWLAAPFNHGNGYQGIDYIPCLVPHFVINAFRILASFLTQAHINGLWD